MLRLTRSQVQPIGLDIGQDSIKMLQLEVSDKSLSVVCAARHDLPVEARQNPELRLPLAMQTVREMISEGGFSGRNVIAAIPREMVHIKNLRLPMMPLNEVESAVQFEARNIFPFDPDQAAIRYLPAGEVRQGNDSKLEVIALAVKNSDVDGFIEQLHHCGCIIQSLDFEPSAIYRGVERFIRRREDENEVYVLVEIGSRRTQVVIGRGKEISFIKPIDIGASNFNDDVSKKLGIAYDEARALRRRLSDAPDATSPAGDKPDPVRQAVHDAIRSRAEDLAREIALCLRYYSVTFRGQRPGKVRLVGGGASDLHLHSILAASLPIPVEIARPLNSVSTNRMKQSDRRGFMSEWAVALGLGLKMTTGYFGARDGKPRDASADGGGAAVEVIDLNRAVEAAPTAPGRGSKEAVHA